MSTAKRLQMCAVRIGTFEIDTRYNVYVSEVKGDGMLRFHIIENDPLATDVIDGYSNDFQVSYAVLARAVTLLEQVGPNTQVNLSEQQDMEDDEVYDVARISKNRSTVRFVAPCGEGHDLHISVLSEIIEAFAPANG